MAAPSGIVWGSKVNDEARIGIYASLSNTNTQTTVTVQIWFWSKYAIVDSNNALYYTNAASSSSATDSKGSVSVKTTVSSGEGWSTTNQIKLYEYTHAAYTRGTSAAKRYLYAKLTNIDVVGAAMYASTTVTIPAKPSYTIAYNANGGSGEPSDQTKWYGTDLTLSSTKPTRAGYTFQGWGTSASDASVDYAAGAKYTANAAVTLYAIWKANTYTITYNANGGSGAPGDDTKTHGVTLSLSTTIPKRTNYTFLGWATNASATAATYSAGGSYTTNANATLYAVWKLAYTKPKISDPSATRCNYSGTLADDGTYAQVKFGWSTTNSVTSIKVEWVSATGTDAGSATITASGKSGTVSRVVGGSFNTELSYIFTLTVADGSGTSYSTSRKVTMSGMEFHIDMGENAVAIGKPAENLLDETGKMRKFFDSKWRAKFRDHVCVGNKLGYQDGNTGIMLSHEGYMHIQRTSAQGLHPYIAFYLDNSTSSGATIRLNSSSKMVEFINAAGYRFGENIYLDYNESICGYDANGVEYNVFKPKNDSNNTIIGYSTYEKQSGNTNIYGNDINFYVANIATPGSYRPYRRKGDSMSLTLRTSGYVTNSGKDVSFWIPFSEPIIGSPTVTVTSGTGFVLRQGNAYTHGSGASTNVTPTEYEATLTMLHGIYVKAVFSNTTNVTNNDSIGIYWNGTITFT